MATSAIEISNRALEAIGADPINSLEETTKPARICARLYPQLRDELLRNHPWNFAAARAVLPALATAPAWGFARAFQIPTDCLLVWRVRDAAREDWRVEGRTIVTDAAAPLYIEYGRQVTDPSEMDPLFASALVARLAMELAMPIADNGTARERMEREYKRLLREARGVDAREGQPGTVDADDFILARQFGGYTGRSGNRIESA